MKSLEQIHDCKDRVVMVPISDVGLAAALLGKVRANLPDDIEILAIAADLPRRRYLLQVRSAEFKRVAEADPIPLLETYFKEIK